MRLFLPKTLEVNPTLQNCQQGLRPTIDNANIFSLLDQDPIKMNNRRQFLKKTSLAGLAFSAAVIPDPINFTEKKMTSSLAIKYRYLNFITEDDPDDTTLNAIKIVRRIVSAKTGLNFSVDHPNRLNVVLKIVQQSMPAESFRIEHHPDKSISITASDPNGMLYGMGKFLHNAALTADGFEPGTWQGLSTPEKPFRMIYFATHFHNFYHDAPIEKVTEYIEELVLWGYNSLNVWFDMHHFDSIKDPAAQAMLDRLALLLAAGKSVGMKSMICVLGNEGYNSTPKELRLTTPLQIRLRGQYGVEICPSQPGGPELILKHMEEELDEFKKRGVQLDYFSVWPYDQGGCGCSQCTPWGSNGYLKMTKKIAALVAQKLPEAKIVQSTWLFDVVEDEGEWAGLAAAYKKEKPPVDYIMADSHETFPKYLLNNPVPGNLPLLNFPEISMWQSWPWGGFGANPLPNRFQTLWNTVSSKVAGGYPYSEGIFEDINKVIYSQFYWNSQKKAKDAIREYVSYEFSAQYADKIVEAIDIMEKNHGLRIYRGKGAKDAPVRFVTSKEDHGAKKAYDLLTAVDNKISNLTKSAWRWRILYLRAMFDHELRLSKGAPNDKIIAGFKELTEIYSAQNADSNVRPPLT